MSLSKLMKTARESIEAEALELTPEELVENETALADTGVTVDVIDEVQAPVAELEVGLDDVGAAEVEADGLMDTAADLEASLSTDGGAAGQGIDPVAANIVSDQIQEAIERFQLDKKIVRPAKESFGTSDGRRQVTRSLAKEAEETATGLRERAVAAIKKAIDWLMGIVKSAFDQSVRIEKRAKALAAQARTSKLAGGQELKINGAFLAGKEPIEVSRGIAELPAGLNELASAVTDGGAATKESINLNPKEVGGVTLRVDFSDKATFVKEEGANDSVRVKALGSSEANNVAGGVAHSIGKLRAAKSQFDAITKNSLGVMNALKSGGDTGDRAKAVATVTAVTRAAGAVMSLAMGTSSRLLDIVDASLKVKSAAEPAAAAA